MDFPLVNICATVQDELLDPEGYKGNAFGGL